MRYITMLLVLLLSMSVAGCGKHCIKLGGGYKGVDAGLEWCLDKEESTTSGTVTFSDEAGNNIYTFARDKVDRIRDWIRDKFGGGDKEAAVGTMAKRVFTPVHPVREILDFLEKMEAKESNKERGDDG